MKTVPGVRQVESDWTSVQQLWCLSSKKEFRAKMTRKLQKKVYLKVTKVDEVSYRRNGLREQIAQAKEGPLGFRRKVKATCLGE